MQKLYLILFTLISINSFSQKGNNRLIAEYEDTLKVMAHIIMNGENESEKKVKDAGLSKLQGKEYIVEDGDCVYFHFNV